MCGPYGCPYGGMGWLMMAASAIYWIILLIGLILVIVWIVRRSSGPAPGRTPLDVLKMRYSRGEITKDEYERMRQDLGNG